VSVSVAEGRIDERDFSCVEIARVTWGEKRGKCEGKREMVGKMASLATPVKELELQMPTVLPPTKESRCRLGADWTTASPVDPKGGISRPMAGRCKSLPTGFVAHRPQMPPLRALPFSHSWAGAYSQ
jgi:hypothetical protein